MIRLYTICLLFFILLSQHGLSQERTIDDERTLKTKIADLLNEMPANNIEEKDALMEDMIALGKEGILGFTQLLTPPEEGGDASVRYALGSITMYVTRQESVQHREMVSQAFLTALEKEDNTAIKRFLIEQVENFGGNEAVQALANYLDHPELCNRAAMALAEIGTSEAEKALGRALESSDEKVLLAVVNALADLQTQDHLEAFKNFVNELLGYAVPRIFHFNQGIIARGKIRGARFRFVKNFYGFHRNFQDTACFSHCLLGIGGQVEQYLIQLSGICINDQLISADLFPNSYRSRDDGAQHF